MDRGPLQRPRTARALALAAGMVLLAASCGARLTKAQIQGALGGGVVRAGQAVAPGDQSTGDTTGADTGAGAGAGGASSGAVAASVAGTSGGGRAGPIGGAAAAACKPDASATDPGLTATEIHFGNVSTVGGPVPGIFQGARDGVNAYFAYINSTQHGVCGRLLKLDFQDDGLDASQNQQAYEQLLPRDLGIVGSFSVVDDGGSQVLGANPTVPDASYALSHARFQIANNFSVQPLKPNAWRLGPLQYFKQRYGDSVITKVAYFTEDAQSAKDAAAGEMSAAQSLGYQFVYTRLTEPTESDFTADVNNMKNKGVQAVMMAGDAGQMARIAATMKAQNFTVKLPNWGSNAYDPQFINASQGGAEGAVLDMEQAMYLGQDAGSLPEVALLNKWLKGVGGKLDLFAAYGWSSAELMVQALTQAGPRPTRANVIAALRGIHRFDANGMLPVADPASKTPPTCYVIVDVKGGQFVRDPASPSGFKCDPGGYS